MYIGNWYGWNWGALWRFVESAANSNFSIAFIASLAGAAGGALAVYFATKRAKARDDLTEEIRAVRASMELLFGMCNLLFNVKQQYVVGLKRTYEEQRERAHRYYLLTITGQIPKGTIVQLGAIETKSLDPPRIRVDALERLLLDKVSITGKAVPSFIHFCQSVETLRSFLLLRNAMLEELKKTPLDEKYRLIFGLPVKYGIDDSYGNYIFGIARSVDDCLYFGTLLVKELKTYGDVLHKRYNKRFKGVIPDIPDLRFEIAHERGLMPNPDDYSSWERSFTTKIARTRGRRLGRLRYVIRRDLRPWKKLLWERWCGL